MGNGESVMEDLPITAMCNFFSASNLSGVGAIEMSSKFCHLPQSPREMEGEIQKVAHRANYQLLITDSLRPNTLFSLLQGSKRRKRR
jgi:hypothetical protein